MLNFLKLNSNKGITIGVILIAIGISFISYQYLLEKKENAYSSMNIELFENFTPIVINDNKQLSEITKEEEEVRITEASSSTTNSDYTYYKGVLEIPKINLKRGFVDMYSSDNTIDKNIAIIKPSEYPDNEKGNFILAAHSGTGYLAFFANLYKLEKGDIAYVYYNQKKYTYKITNIYLQPKVGKLEIKRRNNIRTLTLITCTKDDEKHQTVYILEEGE